MVFRLGFLILIGAAAVACSIGFKKYVWFISIGYGLSIAAIGLCLPIVYHSNLDAAKIIACVLLFGYGLRLGGFLLFRELKSSTYNKKMKGEISDGSNMTPPIKIVLWLSCVLLYFTMTSPIVYRIADGTGSDACFIIGLVIMLCGIILESAADFQKSKAKKKNPRRFCDEGLFKIVRCPNYFGELLIWTGVFVSGFTALQSAGQWIVAVIGYLGIVYVMFSGARRLEIRQDKFYGSDPEYQKYVKSTPIILPLIPLYSVKKHKWLVG